MFLQTWEKTVITWRSSLWIGVPWALIHVHTCTHAYTHNTHMKHTRTPFHTTLWMIYPMYNINYRFESQILSGHIIKALYVSWKVGNHFLWFSNENFLGPHHQAFQTQPLALRQKKKKSHVRSSTLLCLGRADWCSVRWLTRKCCATLDPLWVSSISSMGTVQRHGDLAVSWKHFTNYIKENVSTLLL